MTRYKELINRLSDDINMEFGIEKCAVQHIEKVKGVKTPPLLSDIPSLVIEDSYKYLGITEASNILHD